MKSTPRRIYRCRHSRHYAAHDTQHESAGALEERQTFERSCIFMFRGSQRETRSVQLARYSPVMARRRTCAEGRDHFPRMVMALATLRVSPGSQIDLTGHHRRPPHCWRRARHLCVLNYLEHSLLPQVLYRTRRLCKSLVPVGSDDGFKNPWRLATVRQP